MIKACFDITDNEIFLRSTTTNDPIIDLSTFAARELSDYLMLCLETNGRPCSLMAVDGIEFRCERKTTIIVKAYKLDRELRIGIWQCKSLATELNNALLIQR